LKAYLVHQKVDFPYTHNISILLELCVEHVDWPEEIKNAEELTPYAITTRYPGEYEVVTKENTQKAIQIAKFARSVVRASLILEGVNIEDQG
jgi:HEPN domain-containing protein